jgi:RNA polymerase sigma-70 factor (ECF subfamily)
MRAGDEEGFAGVYRRHQGGIFRFALQMSGSPSIAEEVTPEVFLALIRDPKRFDPARGALSTYLYGIARKQVLRYIERYIEKDRGATPLETETENGDTAPVSDPPGADDVLAELTQQERIDGLRRAILTLPASYREVVVLCELHEMSYAQAAEALGCAVGTVRSRLHRGRAMLLERLRVQERTSRRCCV